MDQNARAAISELSTGDIIILIFNNADKWAQVNRIF